MYKRQGLTGLYASYHLELAAGASIAAATVLISVTAIAARLLLDRSRGRPHLTPTIAAS